MSNLSTLRITPLVKNETGGYTYARDTRIGSEEHRTEILAELRMTLDLLGETCACQKTTRDNIDKLIAMLPPGAATDTLRAQISDDIGKIEAIAEFHDQMIARVRSGTLRRLAELFE